MASVYRVVAVDLAGALGAKQRFNEAPHLAHRTIRGAYHWAAEYSDVGDCLRIVEIPAGQPWDYDGRIVATLDLRTGQ